MPGPRLAPQCVTFWSRAPRRDQAPADPSEPRGGSRLTVTPHLEGKSTLVPTHPLAALTDRFRQPKRSARPETLAWRLRRLRDRRAPPRRMFEECSRERQLPAGCCWQGQAAALPALRGLIASARAASADGTVR